MIADGIGSRIKQARSDAGLKIRPFVAALDKACTFSTVRRWEDSEDGRSAPTLFYALRICEVCGVSLDWLMYGDSEGCYPTTGVCGVSVAERIVNRREALNMTRTELARAIQASATKVRQWETGRCQPSLYYIDKLSTALQISVDELSGRSAR